MGKNVLVIFSLVFQCFVQVQISRSQSIHIKGKVLDCKGGILPMSTITFKSKGLDEKVVKTLCDTTGYYEISTVISHGVLYELHIGHIGFIEKKILVNPDTLADQYLDFFLENDYQSLKEIIVKKKLPVIEKNDTLIFKASTYTKIETKRLQDLLKNMPGFSVSNGIISFNGQPVEKLLIEGDDLSGNNYQMLSKNLSAMIIDKVIVIPDYSEDHIMGKMKKSGKVAVNIELSQGAKNKVNKNIGIGMANLKRYYTEINAVQTRTKFKWFSNFGANSVAMEQDDLSQINFEDSKNIGNEGRNEKFYLSSVSVPRPSLPVEYLANNSDISAGTFFAGKLCSHLRYSGQMKWHDFQNTQTSSEKFAYNILDIIAWKGFKEYHSLLNDKKIESSFQLNYSDAKNYIKFDLDLGNKYLKERSQEVLFGDQNDRFSDTLSRKVFNCNFYLEFSRAISKMKGLRGKTAFYISNFSEMLFSNSSLYSQIQNIAQPYSSWNQFIGRELKYVNNEIATYGKSKKTFYEYGIRSDILTTEIGSVFHASSSFQFNPKKSIKDVSILPFLRFEMRSLKNDFYLIEGNTGIVWRGWEKSNGSDLNYYYSFQFVKSINRFLSFKTKMYTEQKFSEQYNFFPDSLLVGSGVLLNSGSHMQHTRTTFLSIGFNGLDILKQRSWNFMTFFGNKNGEFKNATLQYHGVVIQNLFPANSFNYGFTGNIEYFFPCIKVKSVWGVTVINSIYESRINEVSGISKMFQEIYSASFLTGFNFPVNFEIKQMYECNRLNWNKNSIGNNRQRELWFRLKVNPSKKIFLTVSYLQKFCPGFEIFHGLDLYAIFSAGSKMKFSIRGHNLSGFSYYKTSSNGSLGFSVTDHTLVGRYVLFSLDWLL